ncbi:CehA/McbA family metallohydrolase [Aestuariimicrobium soli]|uniref:CehA/McbA family metallohydrolase n=1 Tax=Aestuariimicrobium soli TaxID=2035834 RepID=UPI003EBAFE3A
MTLITRRFTLADQLENRYPTVAFDVPAGVDSFEVRLAYDRSGAVVDLGCEAPLGAFEQQWRGWSGGARDRFVVGRDRATPGYLPGLAPGTWHVVLGLHQLAPATDPRQPFTRNVEPLEVTVEVLMPAESTIREEPLAPVADTVAETPRGSARGLPAPPGLTWFAGDLHAHTTHSDGSLSIDQLAALAASRGLDFLAVTDHNTTSHFPHLASSSARHGVRLVPGQEVTTHRGHANALGDISWVDFRTNPDVWVSQVLVEDGLLSVNHPIQDDCAWQHPLMVRPPLLEFWHISGFLDQTATGAWAFWRQWREASRAAGWPDPILVGGSDFHHPEQGYPPGTPTTWVAARDSSVDALLDGIAEGQVAISRFPGAGEPVMVRVGDEVVVVDGDGCVAVTESGLGRVVRGDRWTMPAPEGVLRLEAVDRTLLAVC